MLAEYYSHILAFLGGLAVGVFGKFLADFLTDARRKRHAQAQIKQQFKSVRKQMPDLFAEMKKDLTTEGNQLIREFFILSKRNMLNVGSPCLCYYFEDHPRLQDFCHILENHHYVADVTPGNCPKYRLTEEFVSLLLK
jgi:hypothetical protein